MGDFTSASFYGQGQQDLRGPKGEQGDKGDQGDLGPRGEQGLDAYQVWLSLGHSGTEAEFIASLTGPSGRDGKDSAYRYGSFAVVGIQPGEILLDHDVIEAHTLGADFAGSRVSCEDPPDDDWILKVLKNGVQIGTITVSALDGVVTLATVGHVPVSVAVGDVISVVAPDTPDASIGRVRFTFYGTLP
jgi:hypothetical protein